MEDAELLQRYAAERSEAAFAEIVHRHVDLVYSAALRQMRGDHHRAQEVTQMVFVSLARKAASLVRHPVLPAWLYRSTGLAALDLQRREARRKVHERESALEAALTRETGAIPEWDRIRPVLDQAMRQLGERDREAIVLRYFANRPYAEVGRRLGLSENAARMRVDRALDKLRERLGRRGITSTCTALAAGLAAEAAMAAPAGVAAAVASAASAVGTAAAGSGLLLFMSANKITTAAITLFVAAGAATVAVQERANARLAAEVSSLRDQTADLGSLQKENQMLVQAAREANSLAEANKTLDALTEKTNALVAESSGLRQQFAAEASRRRAAAATAPVPGQTLDLSRLDQIPIAKLQTRPSYPQELRRAEVIGSATVDFIVDSNGNVRNAYAANSTDPEFGQAAVDAVSQWLFKPGLKGGQNVNTHMQVPMVFTINDEPSVGQATVFQTDTSRTDAGGPTDWFPAAKN